MLIQKYRTETYHTTLAEKGDDGLLSCGFMHKRDNNASQLDTHFSYYGCFLLLDGSGVYRDATCPDGIPLGPGCLVQRLPERLHSTEVIPDGKWLEFFFCFGAPHYQSLRRISPTLAIQPVLHPGCPAGILSTFEEYLQSFRNAGDEAFPFLLLRAQELILHLYLRHKSYLSDTPSLDEACELLRQNCCSRFTVRDVANLLGVGYESFRKKFRTQTGLSPAEYMIRHRINLAKSKLLDETYTIEQIAVQLGYSDAFSFSAQFKKHTGLSPSAFRRQY